MTGDNSPLNKKEVETIMLPISSIYLELFFVKFFAMILMMAAALTVALWAKKRGKINIRIGAFIIAGFFAICASAFIVDLTAAFTANYEYVVGKPTGFYSKDTSINARGYKKMYFTVGNEDFVLGYDHYKKYLDILLTDETCTVIVLPHSRTVLDIKATPSEEDLEIRKQDMKVIHFEDKNLEKAIMNDLRTKKITVGMIRKTKELCLRDAHIVSLEGLQYAQRLEKLDLSQNKIKDITPLKDLENLKDLNLAHNKVTSIKALRNLKSLEQLRLHDNYIQDIILLKSLENLTVLYISDNSIRDTTMLDSLSGLQIVEDSNNPRKDITSSGLN